MFEVPQARLKRKVARGLPRFRRCGARRRRQCLVILGMKVRYELTRRFDASLFALVTRQGTIALQSDQSQQGPSADESHGGSG
jgi:hypothetical protein